MARIDLFHRTGVFLRRRSARSFNIPLLLLLAGLLLSLWAGKSAFALIGSHAQGGGVSSHTAGHPSRQPVAVNNGLVAWYPLDGNANDASGSGNNGTLTNFTFDNITNGWTRGKFGQGLLFNGTNDYVSSRLNSAVSSDLTISGWFNTSVSGNYELVGILQSGWFEIQMNSNTGVKANCSCGFSISTSNSSSISDGKWHNVVAEVTAGVVNEYVDGKLTGTASGTSDPSFSSPTIWIGAHPGPSLFLNSSVDDVRIYNRALSVSEITQLYQGNSPVNCDQYCVGWWKLDGTGSSTSAPDATSNGNTGTLTNFSFDGTTNGWTSGVFGNGLQFNGSSDYVDTATPITFAAGQGFTYEAWVNAALLGGGEHFIMDRWSGGSTPDFRLTGSTVCIRIFGGSDTCSAISAGKWYFVVGERDPTTSSMRLYVNGALAATSSSANMSATNAFKVRIGAHFSTSLYWNGLLDDVRVYSRALTDYEIYDQYSAGR